MIGKFRHRLTIEQPIQTPDEGGGHTVSWQPLAVAPEIWARIEPLSAVTAATAGQNRHEATHRITLRRREGLTPFMRLCKGSRIFSILSLLPMDENEKFMTLLVRETAP